MLCRLPPRDKLIKQRIKPWLIIQLLQPMRQFKGAVCVPSLNFKTRRFTYQRRSQITVGYFTIAFCDCFRHCQPICRFPQFVMFQGYMYVACPNFILKGSTPSEL